MKRLVLGLLLGVSACGTEVAKPVALDLRNKLPEADSTHFDVLGAEMEVPPGQEIMFCTDVIYDGEDTAFDLLETSQSKFGHHAVLLLPLKPNAPGTVVDCTDAKAMKDYSLLSIADTKLPPGHGSFLPKGKKLVVQSHYVNTGKVPIRVQDVVRVRKLPIAEVTSWDSVLINTTDQINIPPARRTQPRRSTVRSRKTCGCCCLAATCMNGVQSSR